MSRDLLGKPVQGADSPSWVMGRLLRATLGKLFLLLWRVRGMGREHIPSNGPYILAGNHVSYLDPVLLWCLAPRPTHFVARSELFEIPFLAWLLPRVWAFPITRASADREAIARATGLLEQGDVVAMFPEGTRKRAADVGADELGAAHSGVSFIAMRAGVPVVPVGIAGTDKAMPVGAKVPRLSRVTICFGEPVHPDEFHVGSRKERTAAMTAEVMRRIAAAKAVAAKEE